MPETSSERSHREPEATRIDESSKARASEVPEVSMPETLSKRSHCEPEATRIDESSKARASEEPEVSIPETTNERSHYLLRQREDVTLSNSPK